MYKKRRSFFKNKKCSYCGRQGILFRFINKRHEILCDSKDCDKKSRMRAGCYGLSKEELK